MLSFAGSLLCVAVCTTPAHADFESDSRAWNGLADLVALARDEGVELQAPARLDLSQLTPRDGLLLVHPRQPPPGADLLAFMREGGRVGLADDFGAGDALLEVFQIERQQPLAPAESPKLRDNRNVLIATARSQHPLSRDVVALVVNHARTLHHQHLSPIFSLNDGGDTVVLAGAVGSGRLVAISDSSVLINNMLELRGNRIFARNLLHYLARDGRLFLLGGDATLTGAYADPSGATSALSARLAELTQRPLPPRTVQLLSLGIVGLLLFVAATSLPQRRTYLRAVTLAPPEVVAGFAGRVAFFARPQRNLLPPLMSYKLEFEGQLLARLGLPLQTPPAQVTEALRRAGLSEPLLADARALLRELETLRAAQDRPAPPPVVSRRRFRAMIARGDRILAAVYAG